MNLNLGSVTGSNLSLGYTGAYEAYPYPAPYGTVDSNSMFAGIVLTENTSWKFITQFQHLTIDHAAAQLETPPYGNDIADHSTPEEGYTGEDIATIELLYDDDTTAQFTVTVDIVDESAQVPQGTITVTVSAITETQATVSFSYDLDDATSFEHSTDGTNWTEVTSPFDRLGLTEGTLYDDGQLRAVNAEGAADPVGYSFTTEAAAAPTAPTLDSAIPDQSFTEGVAVNLNLATYFSGDDLSYSISGLPLNTGLSLNTSTGTLAGTPDSSDVNDSPLSLTVTATNTEGSAQDTFTATVAPANQVPQGTVTIGSITVSHTTATIPFTYDDTDQTGFEYRLNGGTWQSVASSPAEPTGLTAETLYTVDVRPVNGNGAGTAASSSFTTDPQFAQVPQGTLTIDGVDVYGTLVRVRFSYDDTDANAYEYNLDGGTWSTVEASPIWLADLDAETGYTVNVRPTNNQGGGTADSEAFTTGTASVTTGPTVVVDGTVTDNSALPTKSTGRNLGAMRVSGGYPLIHQAVKVTAADFVNGEARAFRLPMGCELLGAWGITTSQFDIVDGADMRFIVNDEVALRGYDLTAEGWSSAQQYPNGVVAVTRRDRTVVLSSPTLAQPTVGEAVIYLSYILKE